MKKIIVCSDSHGAKDYMSRLFEENNFDFFFFLGDGLSDLGLYQNLPNVYCVKGNCDFFSVEAGQVSINIDGKRVLAQHGNSFGVKSGLGGLIKHAKDMNANIVLFGHTHQFVAEKIDDIWFFDPGALKNGSALLIEIDLNNIKYSRIIL